MTRRNWTPDAREQHALGVAFTNARPRRQVVRRVLSSGRIVCDHLECGHTYTPCRDRRRQYVRTRRCYQCQAGEVDRG